VITRLHTLPACAPVNASPAALRRPAHDSGSPWVASPSVYSSFICSSLPVYPGARFPPWTPSSEAPPGQGIPRAGKPIPVPPVINAAHRAARASLLGDPRGPTGPGAALRGTTFAYSLPLAARGGRGINQQERARSGCRGSENRNRSDSRPRRLLLLETSSRKAKHAPCPTLFIDCHRGHESIPRESSKIATVDFPSSRFAFLLLEDVSRLA
jgi:hypothetical protein